MVKAMSDRTDLKPFVLGPEHNGIRMTAEEFDAITECDELYKYELVHGVVIVHPIPSPQERGPNGELEYLLRTYRYRDTRGSALDDTLPEEYVRTPGCRRRADRVIWAGLGRQPDPARDVPAIVVEFVSAGRRNWRRDYIEKRDEYLAAGVEEYWVIDRFARTMAVFRRRDRGGEGRVIPEDGVYRTELLPGFELPLAAILAAADRWKS
jgi:Uma2 family endonuclease